eukprot:gene18632-24367_t
MPDIDEKSNKVLTLQQSKQTIRKVNALTGELLGSQLSHQADVTKLIDVQNSSNSDDDSLVLSSSNDGVILIWILNSLQVIYELNLNVKIIDVIIPRLTRANSKLFNPMKSSNEFGTLPDYLYEELYLLTSPTNESNHKLVAYDINKRTIRRSVSSVIPCKEDLIDGASHLASSIMTSFDSQVDGSEYILVSSNNRSDAAVLVWSVETNKGVRLSHSSGQISCLCASAESDVLVTGHTQGVITVWHAISSAINQSFKSTSEVPKSSNDIVNASSDIVFAKSLLHWHAHTVVTVCLSADGRRLLSGGSENVVVVWRTSGSAIDEKTFIPRLGAPIASLVTSEDSAQVVVTTTDNSLRVINVARTKYLTVNGLPGHLQDFDPSDLNLKHSHQILHFVPVSKRESSSKTYIPTIKLFAFNHSDVDERIGEHLSTEESMKLWIYNESSGEYKLTAQIDRPHGQSRVTAISFRPRRNVTSRRVQLLSASDDGTLKMWSRSSSQADVWSCDYSFKYRESPIHSVNFSVDGSTLSVAQGLTVHLLDPNTGSGDAYLMIASSRLMRVYDLRNLQPTYTYHVPQGGSITAIASCSDSKHGVLSYIHPIIAVAQSNKNNHSLLLFGIRDEKPISVNALTSSIRSIVISDNYSASRLVSTATPTIYKQQLAAVSISNESNGQVNKQSDRHIDASSVVKPQNYLSTLFDMNSDLLPPVSSLFSAFTSQLTNKPVSDLVIDDNRQVDVLVTRPSANLSAPSISYSIDRQLVDIVDYDQSRFDKLLSEQFAELTSKTMDSTLMTPSRSKSKPSEDLHSTRKSSRKRSNSELTDLSVASRTRGKIDK